ncbi:hypothetical protein IFM89_026557, partial [Coptis chinensis]
MTRTNQTSQPSTHMNNINDSVTAAQDPVTINTQDPRLQADAQNPASIMAAANFPALLVNNSSPIQRNQAINDSSAINQMNLRDQHHTFGVNGVSSQQAFFSGVNPQNTSTFHGTSHQHSPNLMFNGVSSSNPSFHGGLKKSTAYGTYPQISTTVQAGEGTTTDCEYAGGFCIERKIDLTSYFKWWGPNKTRRSDSLTKSFDESKCTGSEDIGSELKALEGGLLPTEPYKMPSLGLSHGGGSTVSAMSILSRSPAYQSLKENVLKEQDENTFNNENKSNDEMGN